MRDGVFPTTLEEEIEDILVLFDENGRSRPAPGQLVIHEDTGLTPGGEPEELFMIIGVVEDQVTLMAVGDRKMDGPNTYTCFLIDLYDNTRPA